jgi:hypothetical protein
LTRRKDRIAERSDPCAWREDEILTLSEAARLFWPSGGPITERSLRKAAKDGLLPISQINRKFFVTPKALKVLSECRPLIPAEKAESPAVSVHEADIAAVRALRGK